MPSVKPFFDDSSTWPYKIGQCVPMLMRPGMACVTQCLIYLWFGSVGIHVRMRALQWLAWRTNQQRLFNTETHTPHAPKNKKLLRHPIQHNLLNIIHKLTSFDAWQSLTCHISENEQLKALSYNQYCKIVNWQVASIFVKLKYIVNFYASSRFVLTAITIRPQPLSQPRFRSFRVKCDNNLSSFHTSSCGVPQGSVRGPLLFVVYTTPLSTLISSLSLDHHLYADDTQLFFSFHTRNFDSIISHLQNALQQISSWMTADLLSRNSPKTEFLLIGLKNQLAKIHNSSLDTSHSARNLGFIFDEHLSLTKLHLYPRPVTITFVIFTISGLTSIRQLPVPLVPT